jgi:hypothetical protein
VREETEGVRLRRPKRSEGAGRKCLREEAEEVRGRRQKKSE